jgi:CBS domain-containing protein
VRKTLPVHECMSRLPSEVDRTERLTAVVDRMREQKCHHIPVMDGSHLFGVLSREDLHELQLSSEKAASDLVAGDVCTRELLTVGPLTPVVEVARSMLERSVGSALVTDGGVLVGIFTATDALRLIAER